MEQICAEGLDIDNMNLNPISRVYDRFTAEGKCADYTSRRGTRIIQSFITWDASGPGSYLAGRKTFFPDESVINNGTVKAIELVGQARMQIIPTQPPKDPIDSRFKDGYLVLIDDCKRVVATLPLSVLNRDQNGGKLQFVNWKNLKWSACYVQFPQAGGIDDDNALQFYIYID